MQKKFRILSVFALVTLFSYSCKDKDYSLDDVDLSGNIVPALATPIGSYEKTATEFLWDSLEEGEVSISLPKTFPFSSKITNTVVLSCDLTDERITEYTDTVVIWIDYENIFEKPFNLKVRFLDYNKNAVPDIVVQLANNGTMECGKKEDAFRIGLGEKELKSTAKIRYIELTLAIDTPVTIKTEDKFSIKLKAYTKINLEF